MAAELVNLDVLARQINEKQAAIEVAWGATLERAREAGELLIQAKNLVGHGNWLSWLDEKCRVSTSMAGKYMRVAREWPRLVQANSQPVTDLGIKDALKMLAKPRRSSVKTRQTIEGTAEEIGPETPSPADIGIEPVPPVSPISLPTTDDRPVSVDDLLERLEQVLLDLPQMKRKQAVEQATERLWAFENEHCKPHMTLSEMRKALPGVAHAALRQSLKEYLSGFRGGRIFREDNGGKAVSRDYAEDFIRLQRAHGWKEGEPLIPGYILDMNPSKSTAQPLLRPKMPSRR